MATAGKQGMGQRPTVLTTTESPANAELNESNGILPINPASVYLGGWTQSAETIIYTKYFASKSTLTINVQDTANTQFLELPYIGQYTNTAILANAQRNGRVGGGITYRVTGICSETMVGAVFFATAPKKLENVTINQLSMNKGATYSLNKTFTYTKTIYPTVSQDGIQRNWVEYPVPEERIADMPHMYGIIRFPPQNAFNPDTNFTINFIIESKASPDFILVCTDYDRFSIATPDGDNVLVNGTTSPEIAILNQLNNKSVKEIFGSSQLYIATDGIYADNLAAASADTLLGFRTDKTIVHFNRSHSTVLLNEDGRTNPTRETRSPGGIGVSAQNYIPIGCNTAFGFKANSQAGLDFLIDEQELGFLCYGHPGSVSFINSLLTHEVGYFEDLQRQYKLEPLTNADINNDWDSTKRKPHDWFADLSDDGVEIARKITTVLANSMDPINSAKWVTGISVGLDVDIEQPRFSHDTTENNLRFIHIGSASSFAMTTVGYQDHDTRVENNVSENIEYKPVEGNATVFTCVNGLEITTAAGQTILLIPVVLRKPVVRCFSGTWDHTKFPGLSFNGTWLYHTDKKFFAASWVNNTRFTFTWRIPPVYALGPTIWQRDLLLSQVPEGCTRVIFSKELPPSVAPENAVGGTPTMPSLIPLSFKMLPEGHIILFELVDIINNQVLLRITYNSTNNTFFSRFDSTVSKYAVYNAQSVDNVRIRNIRTVAPGIENAVSRTKRFLSRITGSDRRYIAKEPYTNNLQLLPFNSSSIRLK